MDKVKTKNEQRALCKIVNRLFGDIAIVLIQSIEEETKMVIIEKLREARMAAISRCNKIT